MRYAAARRAVCGRTHASPRGRPAEDRFAAMATIQDVNDLFERIRRIGARLIVTTGPGSDWKADVPNFGIQTYKVTGMKSPEELEDDIATLSLWIWSLKDHLKLVLASLGQDPLDIERFVNSDRDLQVCADIANSAKHLPLRTSRTGQFLKAGRLCFSLPLSSVGELVFRPNEVQIDVSRPDLVKIAIPVIDRAGNTVGDVIAHLHAGVIAWERCAREAGVLA